MSLPARRSTNTSRGAPRPNASTHAEIQPGRTHGEARTRSASSSQPAAMESIRSYLSTGTPRQCNPDYYACVERGRVLCGVDEATGSLAGVRGLRAAGYEPWLALSQAHTYVARSRAAAGSVQLPNPKADPDRYALQLAAEVRRLQANVVLPFTEGTLRALTGTRRPLQGVPFWVRALAGNSTARLTRVSSHSSAGRPVSPRRRRWR